MFISGFKFSQLEMSKHLSPSTVVTLTFLSFAAEVVLSLLIESFEFTPSEKEISWEMATIVSPIVVGGEKKPQLPVVVKLIKPIY